jgi:hypothetical protein
MIQSSKSFHIVAPNSLKPSQFTPTHNPEHFEDIKEPGMEMSCFGRSQHDKAKQNKTNYLP